MKGGGVGRWAVPLTFPRPRRVSEMSAAEVKDLDCTRGPDRLFQESVWMCAPPGARLLVEACCDDIKISSRVVHVSLVLLLRHA